VSERKPVEPSWYPWRGVIANRLLRVDFVRWDRFVVFQNMIRIYGWIDREDGRADFVLLDLFLYPGPSVEASVMSSSAERSRDLSALLRESDAEPHIDCERVEDHFGTLADLYCTRAGESRRRIPAKDVEAGMRITRFQSHLREDYEGPLGDPVPVIGVGGEGNAPGSIELEIEGFEGCEGLEYQPDELVEVIR
jgi:hypothetical protein